MAFVPTTCFTSISKPSSASSLRQPSHGFSTTFISKHSSLNTSLLSRNIKHMIECTLNENSLSNNNNNTYSSQTSQTSQTSSSFNFEDLTSKLIRLQEELDKAIAAEEFKSAANIHNELEKLTKEDSVQILAMLMSYYDAFTNRNVDRIRHHWHDKDNVICQHPLTSSDIGYANVINGYTYLFSTLPSDFSIAMSDVRISVHGDVAYVTCIELPRSQSFSSMTPVNVNDELSSKSKVKWHGLFATHILQKVFDYRKQKFQYLLVHHISSPVLNNKNR